VAEAEQRQLQEKKGLALEKEMALLRLEVKEALRKQESAEEAKSKVSHHSCYCTCTYM